MGEDINNQLESFNYIVKLNDRELSKNQSTGFTLWAIFAAIGVIIINIIDILPNVFQSEANVFFTLYCFTVIWNTRPLLGILFVWIFYEKGQLKLDNEALTHSGRYNKVLIYRTSWVASILFVCLNIYVTYNSKYYNLISWPFVIYLVYWFFQILNCINAEIQFKKSKKEIVDLIIISKETQKNSKLVFVFTSILIIMNILCAIAFFQTLSGFKIIFLKEIILRPDITKGLLKCVIYMVGLYFLIAFATSQIIEIKKRSWMQQFEKEIFIKNLNYNKIKRKFEYEFLGKISNKMYKSAYKRAKEKSASL